MVVALEIVVVVVVAHQVKAVDKDKEVVAAEILLEILPEEHVLQVAVDHVPLVVAEVAHQVVVQVAAVVLQEDVDVPQVDVPQEDADAQMLRKSVQKRLKIKSRQQWRAFRGANVVVKR
jgi:hypothetical protein